MQGKFAVFFRAARSGCSRLELSAHPRSSAFICGSISVSRFDARASHCVRAVAENPHAPVPEKRPAGDSQPYLRNTDLRAEFGSDAVGNTSGQKYFSTPARAVVGSIHCNESKYKYGLSFSHEVRKKS